MCENFARQHSIQYLIYFSPLFFSIAFFLQDMDLGSILSNNNVKEHIRTAATHIGPLVYGELSIYVWFICIYNLLLLFLIIANLYLNICIVKRQREQYPCSALP
jgi:hypothetical protein